MYSPWIEEKETITKSGDGITGMKPSPRFQHVAVSMDNSNTDPEWRKLNVV